LNRNLASIDTENSREVGLYRPKPGKKVQLAAEQNSVVAASSQLRTMRAPALPRSNQIEATLFDEGRSRK
jgi:hypothetical protein